MAEFDSILRQSEESNEEDAVLRNYKALRHHANTGGFDDRLRNILDQYGGALLADLDYEGDADDSHLRPGDASDQHPTVRNLIPRMDLALHTAWNNLGHVIRGHTDSIPPIIDTITYQFVDADGRQFNFELDPAEPLNDITRKFEETVDRLAQKDQVKAQFVPIYRSIKSNMVDDGWDRKEAVSKAILHSIKEVCDIWADDKL